MISTTSPTCDRVGLVVSVADGPPPQHLAVLGMGHEPFDHDPPGLGHLVGRDDPDFRLAAGAGRRRLVTGRACWLIGFSHGLIIRSFWLDRFGFRDLTGCHSAARPTRSLDLTMLKIVLIRAISRLALTISLGASSRSVSLWRRRRNRLCWTSFEQQVELLVGLLA